MNLEISTSLAQCNLHMLEEYKPILSELTPEQYQYTRDPVFPSSIGAHLRHDLDHYLNFLSGLSSRKVDYEKRSRNPHIEHETDTALTVIAEVQSRLTSRVTEDHPLEVHLENSEGPFLAVRSCIRRELDFLLSHTVHHQAIISMILKDQGVSPNETFGIAPSTLRYKKSCAQ